MAPPRLQCLNASRHIAKKSAAMRVMFSTSQIQRADDAPPRPSRSAADFLASLGDDTPSFRVPLSRSQSSQNPTSINLPHTPTSRPMYPRSIPNPGSSNATSSVQRLIARSQERRDQQGREPGQMSRGTVDELQKHKLSADLSKQITRRWKAGDVYAPHDLSAVEMSKWKNRGRPVYDVFDVLDFKPSEHYRNFSIMSEYMTPMGRIKHSNETGLRPVNQRRIARAIRRSIGMGMMPSVHRHPEILQKVAARQEMMSPMRAGPL